MWEQDHAALSGLCLEDLQFSCNSFSAVHLQYKTPDHEKCSAERLQMKQHWTCDFLSVTFLHITQLYMEDVEGAKKYSLVLKWMH